MYKRQVIDGAKDFPGCEINRNTCRGIKAGIYREREGSGKLPITEV